jgi:hypothetical protein
MVLALVLLLLLYFCCGTYSISLIENNLGFTVASILLSSLPLLHICTFYFSEESKVSVF